MDDVGLRLFRFGERVDALKQSAYSQWPEISPEAMAYFAGEVLASGVVLWALLNQTGLDTMRWPGDLPVVLGLKVGTGSEHKIGQELEEVCTKAGLVGAQADQLKQTFLEMLQWQVVEQLHASLFNAQRHQLAQILSHSNFSLSDRTKMLDEMAEFLRGAGVFAYDAQSFFEKALTQSLDEVRRAFGY